MPVDEAYQLEDANIVNALGGLPEPKQHCSNHAATALREAINDFVLRDVTKEREA